MEKLLYLLLLLFSTVPKFVNAQANLAAYNLLTDKDKSDYGTIAINNTPSLRKQIDDLGLTIVHFNKHYLYVRSTVNDLQSYVESGKLESYIIDYYKPVDLADSVRAFHRVNEVHDGVQLSNSYTGNDVIIGFVDTGIEIEHPDFQDENGNSRILRIWDQTSFGGNIYSHYGYGILWTNEDIDNGLCSQVDSQAHGSTVAGIAVGNGLAAGENKGVAPDANIVMVKYASQGGSWANKVTDGIEYIFKLADSLGKKAVVNVSLGAYLGSHDGMDAATLRAVDYLNEKDGRILVTACGNSDNLGKYHVGATMNNDHFITFFRNESATAFGSNRVFFDGYSSMDSIDFSFAFTIVNPDNNHEVRGATNFRPIFDVNNITIIDTIRNAQGQVLARVEFSGVIEGPNFHYNVLTRMIDSFSYQLGFATMGSGRYDLWSGNGIGYNRLVDDVLPNQTFLNNHSYVYPDLNQSIVSGWTCHPEVVSVGNIRNRFSFMTRAGVVYTVNPGNDPGQLSINSSKGPNRNGIIKPDIVATGDVILTAGPFSFLDAHPEKTTPSGFHMTNGGTSMASPVVAAIAALYLERCEDGNHKSFLKLLQETARANNFMNDLPNNSYGAGYADAWGLMKKSEQNLAIEGNVYLCDEGFVEVDRTQLVTNIEWDNGSNLPQRPISALGAYHYTGTNEYGCEVLSDTLNVNDYGINVTLTPIQENNAQMYLFTDGADRYEWYLDDVLIPGYTSATLPFVVNGSSLVGVIKAKGYSATDCFSYTSDYSFGLGIDNVTSLFQVYPNPTRNELTIKTDVTAYDLSMYDAQGRAVEVRKQGQKLDVTHLERGVYIVKMQFEGLNSQTKVVIE